MPKANLFARHASRLSLTAAVPAAAVAVIAGIVSFGHIETLALSVHQPIADARLLPFAVDFLIVAGSVILLAGSPLGWLGVIPGVMATLFANVESGLPYGPLAATVAVWPAVAFTLATLMLERWLKIMNAPGATVSSPPTGRGTGTQMPPPAPPRRKPRRAASRAAGRAAAATVDETALLAELLASPGPLPSVRALSLKKAGIVRSRQVERVLEEAHRRMNGHGDRS